MKRSEINQLISEAKDFFDEMNFKLPPWGYWPPEEWQGKADKLCRNRRKHAWMGFN